MNVSETVRLSMDETELQQRFREGDEDAFRELVERHHPSILNLCFKYVGNREDAEEVAQDVFIRAYRARASYEPRAKFSTYLYRIAVNLSLNRIRDRKRRLGRLENSLSEDRSPAVAEGNPRPDEILERKEKEAAVREALDSLPEKQKTAVILKRFQGLSYDEIAGVMACSVSAVEARLHRAKLNLQKSLKGIAA